MLHPYSLVCEDAMRRGFAFMNEHHRRLYAAAEALKLGRSGLLYLSRFFYCDPNTIRRGLRELQQPSSLLSGRSRKKRGRKTCLSIFPDLDAAFLEVVTSYIAGDPMQAGNLVAQPFPASFGSGKDQAWLSRQSAGGGNRHAKGVLPHFW